MPAFIQPRLKTGSNLRIIKIIVAENAVFHNVFDGHYVDIHTNITNLTTNEVPERRYAVRIINCDINKLMFSVCFAGAY